MQQELNELQTVAAPEHLKTHRIAQTVQSNRFPVRLCTHSFELVTTFVTSAKPLALLLSIINERLQVQVQNSKYSIADCAASMFKIQHAALECKVASALFECGKACARAVGPLAGQQQCVCMPGG